MPYAHELAKSAEEHESRRLLIGALPSLLSSGTSALEVARHSRTPPQEVDDVLQELSTHGVVKYELVGSSSSGVPYGDRLYYMGREGREFFRYVRGLSVPGRTY